MTTTKKYTRWHYLYLTAGFDGLIEAAQSREGCIG